MSFLYDHKNRRPQPWTYPFFVLLTIGLCYFIYSYGAKKADEKSRPTEQNEEKFQG